MASSRNSRGIVIGIIGTLLVLLAIALIVILTGTYNVAATDRHTAPVSWALHTTMENSVRSQASGLTAPAITPARVEAGGSEYKAMCQQCHGGVESEHAYWAEGLYPYPPALAEEAEEWSTQEIFWLVKHGVKMTGMPAFGPTHDDDTLWNIAAFVKTMPNMSAADYAAISDDHALAETGEDNSAAGDHGADGHAH